jgi:D-mannonate dehydratase
MFDWFRSDDPTGLDAYSKNDLELEAKSVKTDMKVKENDLDRLDNEFLSKAKEASDAAGPKRDRLKSEAAAIKQNYEQQQAEYQAMLKEYTTIRTLANAKSRLNSRSDSMLQEMDERELQEFREQVKTDVLSQNQNLAQMEEVANTIDETLTAVTGSGGAQVDDDVETVISAFEQGDDLSDFSLADHVEENETDQSSHHLSDHV